MFFLRGQGPLLCSLALVACTRENPAYDEGSGDGGSKGTLDGADASTTVATVDGSGSAGASGETTLGGGSTGAMDCPGPPALDVAGYGRCGGCMGTCLELESAPPVIFAMVVCAGACESSCDCPVPESGTATPSCGSTGCVLDCAEGRVCPEGMTCHAETQQCLWNKAYGPCDDSCISGHCLFIPMVGSVCPTLDCHVGEAFDASLCPPPSSGNATPTCFGPDDPELLGQGWCVLPCEGATMCPTGMECMQGWCMHPV